MQLHLVFLSSGITRLVLGIVPIGIFPRTPSFTNLSSVDSPGPLTGHGYRLHTLHDFVDTRCLTFVRNVPLLSTHSSDCLSSSVCNLMRRRPIHLLPLAQVAWRSPLIYPANRIRSEGRPRRIRCYKMCSIDSGLWACFLPPIFPPSAICTFRNTTYTISRFPCNVTCQVTRIPYGSLCPAFWFESSKQRERQKDQPPPNTGRC